MAEPVVGMSGMDGVTDATMRHITAKYGRPDVMLTEFTSVEGLSHHAIQLLRDFHYTPIQRPIVAQLYGSTPEAFRRCAVLACALGFDGIDINMGCPSATVARHGCGAALIKAPALAGQIIRAARAGVQDWVRGASVDALGFKPEFAAAVKASPNYIGDAVARWPVPVSVKTRIGYDSPVTESWIAHLLEVGVDNISLHGRTLAQKYTGEADWSEIAKAARLARQTETTLLGNGDIKNPSEVRSRVEQAGVHGVLIGRATMGNPWFFSDYRTSAGGGSSGAGRPLTERIRVALEHAHYFEFLNETIFKDDPFPFINMRKHFGWYLRDLPGVAQLRQTLFHTTTSRQVEKIFEEFAAVHR